MRFTFLCVLALGLSACVNPYGTSPYGAAPRYQLASSHWSDVSKIRDEATRLSVSVRNGDLTKVQAAQRLNQFRLKLVGNNPVDDSMYAVYLRSAKDSQNKKITTAQSKQIIVNGLQGWQTRWVNIGDKPHNPAFTNFLNEVMGLPPLK